MFSHWMRRNECRQVEQSKEVWPRASCLRVSMSRKFFISVRGALEISNSGPLRALRCGRRGGKSPYQPSRWLTSLDPYRCSHVETWLSPQRKALLIRINDSRVRRLIISISTARFLNLPGKVTGMYRGLNFRPLVFYLSCSVQRGVITRAIS